jgi:hypothetical protein
MFRAPISTAIPAASAITTTRIWVSQSVLCNEWFIGALVFENKTSMNLQTSGMWREMPVRY